MESVALHAGVRLRPKDRDLQAKRILQFIEQHPDAPAFLADPDNPEWGRSDFVEAVLNILLTGETYFFRNRPHCEAIATHLLPQWFSTNGRPVKLWSAGCSTGEEPYTLNIMVKEFSPTATPETVRIFASDVNPNALKTARSGEYGEWSLRTMEGERRKMLFHRRGKRFHLKSEFTGLTVFFHHNLCRDPLPGYLLGLDNLDLIICRNVLMYLKAEDISLIVEGFARTLHSEGYLMVDYSEAHLIRHPLLRPVQAANAMMFQRVPAAAAVAESGPKPSRGAPQEAVPRSGGGQDTAILSLLALARMEIQSRQFERAEHLLRRAVEGDPLSSEAHYLLGMLHAEAGRMEEAKAALRRSLFLDPRRGDALKLARRINGG